MEILAASAIQNVTKFFEQGGVFMGFLLVLSIAAGTVIILRILALRESAVIPTALAQEIETLEPGGNLDRLQALIARHPSALARILTTLIQHLSWPRSEAIDAVQTRARHEVTRLESGLMLLEIATGIAPLFGLLGTLTGLVGIFGAVGGDPTVVAKGISEALNCTIAGLAVSVPCLATFSYFQRRVEKLSIEMESLVADLIAKCYAHGAAPQLERVTREPVVLPEMKRR
ncbi:MotA/TolQ/ExbB proton channel family protein [soil metagenome]